MFLFSFFLSRLTVAPSSSSLSHTHTHTHTHTQHTHTQGPGKYREEQFGSKIGGGVISTSKPKSTIEWVQYYAGQIPAPGQYKPVDPNLDPANQPSVRIPDFVGKTNLENIIYQAKQLPGLLLVLALSRPILIFFLNSTCDTFVIFLFFFFFK